MSGVPLYKLDKYCDIFLQNNYHVIVVSQTSCSSKPEREVTHILSPGTTLSEFNHNIVENNLMIIFIEKIFLIIKFIILLVFLLLMFLPVKIKLQILFKIPKMKIMLTQNEIKGLFLIIILLKQYFIQKILIWIKKYLSINMI